MIIRSLLPLLALTLFAGCDWLVGPEEGSRLGVISFYDDPVVAVVPEAVDAGVPFGVTIHTYGDGCVREGGTEAAVSGNVADVTPFDVHSGANVCTDILNIFEHAVTLTLTEPGTALVRFHGIQEPEGERITVERSITVR